MRGGGDQEELQEVEVREREPAPGRGAVSQFL